MGVPKFLPVLLQIIGAFLFVFGGIPGLYLLVTLPSLAPEPGFMNALIEPAVHQINVTIWILQAISGTAQILGSIIFGLMLYVIGGTASGVLDLWRARFVNVSGQ